MSYTSAPPPELLVGAALGALLGALRGRGKEEEDVGRVPVTPPAQSRIQGSRGKGAPALLGMLCAKRVLSTPNKEPSYPAAARSRAGI